MYTADELIEYARAQGVKVSTRQVREWTKDGLLPAPTRAAVPGQGKAGVPYRYPAIAFLAVPWLGLHRRRIDGVEATKFWMWLEEFDYVDVDLNRVVMTACEAAWNDVRLQVPRLPSLQDILHDPSVLEYDRADQVLDDYAAAMIAPAWDRGEPAEQLELTVVKATMLGLPFPLEDSGTVDEVDGSWVPSSIEVFEHEVQKRLEPSGKNISRTLLRAFIAKASIPRMFYAAATKRIAWKDVRRYFYLRSFIAQKHNETVHAWFKYRVPMFMSSYLAVFVDVMALTRRWNQRPPPQSIEEMTSRMAEQEQHIHPQPTVQAIEAMLREDG